MMELRMPGLAQLAQVLQRKKARYLRDLSTGFVKVGREIVTLLQKEWLSGRIAGDLGLNIITGNLYNSIGFLTTVNGAEIESNVFNHGASYWYWNAGHSPNHPNRFPVDAIFQDQRERYTTVMQAALARLGA